MTPLQNQSRKAQKINSVICLTNGVRHKHVTACRSLTSPELNYQQVIQFTGKVSHSIFAYKVTCTCRGNGHTYTLCQHAISGIWTTIKALGKCISLCSTFKDAKRLLNLYASKSGKLVKLIGESGFCYGVISNGR